MFWYIIMIKTLLFFYCKKTKQIKYGWFHSCDARHFESFACENCFVFAWHFHFKQSIDWICCILWNFLFTIMMRLRTVSPPPPQIIKLFNYITFLAPKSSKQRNNWFYLPALFPNQCILNMCEHLVIYSSYPQTKDIYMYYQIFFSNTPAFTTKNKTTKGTINKCKSQATITEQTYH